MGSKKISWKLYKNINLYGVLVFGYSIVSNVSNKKNVFSLIN